MLIENWQNILWAILAVQVSRAVVVYSLRFFSREIPFRWQHILFWGGLRGALAPALALGLPASFGLLRGQIQAMVFGVILFNLLIQGTSLGSLVRRLKLADRSENQDEYERRHARAVASRAAYAHLEKRFNEGLISFHIWQNLAALFKRRSEALSEAVGEILQDDPGVEAEELDTAWREALLAQRSTFTTLLRDGVITEDTFSLLIGEVDQALGDPQTNWAAFARNTQLGSIDSLVTAIIQERDAENVINALNKLGVSITRLPSTGGLLRKRNVTLLVGIPNNQENHIFQTLKSICTLQIVNQDILEEPVEVSGATVFTFDIERYEEL